MKILLLNNNIDFDKIKLHHNDRYNFYNIQYDLSYILINYVLLYIDINFHCLTNERYGK